MKWSRILVAGIGTGVAALLVITLAATGYAFKLAFEVRGAPDQATIGQFAAHLGRAQHQVHAQPRGGRCAQRHERPQDDPLNKVLAAFRRHKRDPLPDPESVQGPGRMFKLAF